MRPLIYFKLILFTALFLLTSPVCLSQDSILNKTKEKDPYVYALSLHDGFISVHTAFVENTRSGRPLGLELELSKQNVSLEGYKHWGVFTRRGWTFNYFDFRTPILGHSVSSAYFIEPVFKMGNHWETRVKACAGISFLDHPNSVDTNNHTYSGYINAYLQLSVGATLHLDQHTSLYLKGNFNHNSNGGYLTPNRGINFPTASIGIMYCPTTNRLPRFTSEMLGPPPPRRKPEFLIGILATSKNGFNRHNVRWERQPFVGMFAEWVKPLTNVDALSFGAEVYYDGAMRLTNTQIAVGSPTGPSDTRFYYDNTSCIFAGPLIGNALFLNKFTFTQEIGYHIIQNTKMYEDNYLFYKVTNLFQRYGLRYTLSDRWQVGFNVLARGRTADNFDVRGVYSFHKR